MFKTLFQKFDILDKVCLQLENMFSIRPDF